MQTDESQEIPVNMGEAKGRHSRTSFFSLKTFRSSPPHGIFRWNLFGYAVKGYALALKFLNKVTRREFIPLSVFFQFNHSNI